jgi:predicted nucleic acid-binding Zn ribbon protein
MFCKYCGKKNIEEARFCKYCGKNLSLETSIKKRKKSRKYIQKIVFVLITILLVLSVSLFIHTSNDISDNEEYNKPEIFIDSGMLYELGLSIEPVGYFSKSVFFDSENISIEEWLSYVEYTKSLFDNFELANSEISNQKQINSAVVKIICKIDDYYLYGSGTNIDSGGYILTNLHVIEGVTGSECMVGFPDPESGLIREAYWATPIIDKDNKTSHDLAILSVEDPVWDDKYNVYGFYERMIEGKFPYYEEDDECLDIAPQLGDQIFVLGYPFLSGGALTITDGLISSLYSSSGYIITSAKISSGNSGGLAVDNKGCFVGVPTAFYLEKEEEIYGEIIDAYFVYEFYEVIFDHILDYVDRLEEDIYRDRDRSYAVGESNISVYLSVPGALRECASTDCQIIRYYAEGAKVVIEDIDVIPNWHKVIARDDHGNLITGYMHSLLFE